MKTLHKVLLGLGLVVLGAAFGRFATPEKIVTKEVIKTVEVEKKKTNKDKTTKIVEKTNPDGSKTKETVIVDKSKSESDKLAETEKSKKKTVTNGKSKNNLSVLAGVKLNKQMLKNKIVYGLQFQRSILGPIKAGLFGFSDRVGGISLGLDF